MNKAAFFPFNFLFPHFVSNDHLIKKLAVFFTVNIPELRCSSFNLQDFERHYSPVHRKHTITQRQTYIKHKSKIKNIPQKQNLLTTECTFKIRWLVTPKK